MNPSNLSFTYKKYLNAPSAQVELYLSTPSSNVGIASKPNWVKVVMDEQDRDPNNGYKITRIAYKVSIDPQYANLLSVGVHTGVVRIESFEGSSFKPVPYFLDVSVDILENQVLSFSKDNFNFEHTLGSTPPASQPLTITTENAWNIVANENWVTFSETSANGTKAITIGVDVSGLPVGVYEATFQADDGDRVKQGTVNLVISGDDTSGDFLKLSRGSLSFSEIFQEPPTRSATLNIETSQPVTITSTNPWLQLSAGNFAAGTHELTVNTTATEALAIGSYTGSIKVQSGFSTKTIGVLLRIVENQTEGIESGKLYYAKDRNTLVLGSATNNAEALIEFSASASGQSVNYQRRIPFFNDVAEVIVGLETSRLLKAENLPQQLVSGAFSPVRPLAMDFTIFDKVINSTAVTERQSFAQVQFLNGTTPKQENILTKIPSQITVPKDGVVALSFYSETPVQEINITGAVTATISISNLETKVYTAVIALGNYNLNPGDKVEIAAGPVTVSARIKPTQLSTCRLIFENEWDCPEVINLDGIAKIDDEDESTVVDYALNGKMVSRIIETREPVSFRIGTGNIYSDAEMKWLAGIMRSKRSWLEIDGTRIEVIKSFRSFPTSETRKAIRNLTLNFEAAVI